MNKHIALVGATASGKSAISVEIAKRMNREIISLDSMQIYKGMEIGTGVVPIEERQGIIHHMLGIIEPVEIYSVSNFQNDVKKILSSRKNHYYVLAGGTGLYTHAVIDDYSLAPTDENVRKSIEEKYNLYEENTDEASLKYAFEYLKTIDSQAAEKIEPGNIRRIVRALEVIELTGKKFSDIGEGIQTFDKPAIDVIMIGLRYERDALRERIFLRVNKMFELGWIEEVRALEGQWESLAPNARAAIGYENIVQYIRAGGSKEELAEKIVNKTAQFSRRQRKWFERDPRIQWIDCDNLKQEEIVARCEAIIA